MFKSFKYRIYPTEQQKTLIHKHCGAVRFIYNLALETKQTAYAGYGVNLSCFDLMKQLPELKKECEWLKEVNSQSLQAPMRNLDNAFTRFYKGQTKFPKFKKKSNSGSFHIQQSILIVDNKLSIPKFKEGIKIKLHRKLQGTIKSATVSFTPSGKYFVSILCDTGEEFPVKPKITRENTVGIDLGIKDFVITSDGEVFSNPKYLRQAESKLKFTQRKYSKHKGKRTRLKLVKLHEKVKNQRKDFLDKLSYKLVSENQTLAVETLQVTNMLQNHQLNKSIQDAGWGMFVTMLEYKSDWYGTNIIKIGTFEPSSKTCSNCGKINKELTLQDREWTCKGCSIKHNRDINAAVNIKNFALRNYVSGTDTQNHSELPTLVGVLTYEASI